ncbi:protein Aster-B isoform X2 [Hydra vulgaris]|uniref:protein Aster-B isoform X2 n=2 Tax=Hydra vulgaris TaxID=6087 RepID=UPI001F5E45A5|nr:protein Aster-B isoform X1 [Hydra vulgaris]
MLNFANLNMDNKNESNQNNINNMLTNGKIKDSDKMPSAEFYPLLTSTLPSINNCIFGLTSENKVQNVLDSSIKDKWNKTPKILAFRKNKKKKLQRSRMPSCRKPSTLSNISIGQTDESLTDYREAEKDTSDLENNDVQCPCNNSHLEKEFANEILDFDVDILFNDLFSQDSDIMKDLFQQKNYKDWKYTQNEESGFKVQILNYTVPLNYSIGPKQSFTECKQVFSKENKSGSFYVVDVQCTSFGVPYADSFNIAIRYCLTRKSGKQSQLQVTGEVIFTKKLFAVVKNMISRTTEDALNDYFKCLLQSLRSKGSISSNKKSTCIPRSFSKINKKNQSLRKTLKQINTSALDKQKSSIPNIDSKKYFGMSFDSFWFILILCSFIGFLIFVVNIYTLMRLASLENIILTDRPFFKDTTTFTHHENQNNLLSSEITKFYKILQKTEGLLQQIKIEITENRNKFCSYTNNLMT